MSSGENSAELLACPDCAGTGWDSDATLRGTCAACNGTGSKRAPAAPAVDAELAAAWRECFGLVVCRSSNKNDMDRVSRFWSLMNQRAGLSKPTTTEYQLENGLNVAEELIHKQDTLMNEEVAKAIYYSDTPHASWDRDIEYVREAYRENARAAIAAMERRILESEHEEFERVKSAVIKADNEPECTAEDIARAAIAAMRGKGK